MSSGKEGRLRRFLSGVEDYWPEGVGVLATIALATLAVWLGDLPKRDLWKYCLIGGFVLAAAVYLLTTIASARRSRNFRRAEHQNDDLVRRNEDLEHALEAAEETARADYYDLVRQQLRLLAEELGFGDTERITVYSHDGTQFVLLGRYSKNRSSMKRVGASIPTTKAVSHAPGAKGRDSRTCPTQTGRTRRITAA